MILSTLSALANPKNQFPKVLVVLAEVLFGGFAIYSIQIN